jgi:hypothetical protein
MKQRVAWVSLRGFHTLEWETDDPKPIVECDCGNAIYDCGDGMASLQELGWMLGDGFCPACRPKLNRDLGFCPF